MVANRLLDIAIEHFGRLGFEGASTRAIAKASDTAMSSITYHFGGKEGLYLAAADRIAEVIGARQETAIALARQAAEGPREGAVTACLGLLDSFAQMMLDDASQVWARFIIREQFEPSEAFERLWSGLMRHVADVLVTLVTRARDDLDARDARATAILLIGQAIVMRAGRASVCRVLGVERIDPATADLLRARLRANALSILEDRT